MERIKVNLVVIGSGPAGQKAAIQAAKLGKQVAIIEQESVPGGGSLNSGTIPSKSLREAILDLTRFHQRSFYGKNLIDQEISINDLNYRLNKVLEEERRIIARQFRKNQIRLLIGRAQFVNHHELLVKDGGYSLEYLVHADCIIIATGSQPRNPLEVPFDDYVILDSTRLLSIDKVPKTLIVLGGGIIGSEYASFFAALGTQVTVVDKRSHLLPHLDSEIGIHLQTALSEIGLRFLGHKVLCKIEKVENKASVQFEDGSALQADVLLYALGRVAAVEGLGLDNVGIGLNEKGYIPVNGAFQTKVAHIYAVGDVIGHPSLASTSMEQGRLAARHAFGAPTHPFPTLYPIGIYTIPEISCVGLTEDECQRLGYNYEVGRAYYYEIARGHISGTQEGMFKLIFHRETLAILGVHIIGRSATEMVHIGQVAMHFHATIDFFISQVFNYPTFAEGYRIAALNGLNKIKR